MATKIIISTKYGNVNASSTATIHGEGSNITGFKMTNLEATHTVEQANSEYPMLGTWAEAWAEGKSYTR